MRNFSLAFFILLMTISCHQNLKLDTDNSLKDSLIGDWLAIPPSVSELDSNEIYIEPIVLSGYAFSKDSIEFYYGLYKTIKNDTSGSKKISYLGSFEKYAIKEKQLYRRDIETKEWKTFWKIKEIKDDTLHILYDDNSTAKFKRLKYQLKQEKDFDKIVYSSSVCYGICPAIDVSLDRSGNIVYQGRAFVDSLGIFSGKINQETTDFIYKKFEKAAILNLENEYIADYMHSQIITTTFIKNGKIVKSIHDYGRVSPKELVWAYIPLGNIYNLTKLTPLEKDENLPNLEIHTYTDGKKEFALEDSESFFLWTELRKGKKTQNHFIPKYKMSFNYIRYINYNAKINVPENIKSIESDGQYFKFEFKDKASTTYDLGYNFIERNFKEKKTKGIYVAPVLTNP